MQEMEAIALRLHEAISAGFAPWSAERFEQIALDLYSAQLENIPSYRSYCRAVLGDAQAVDCWQEIPPVPVAAFKHRTIGTGVSPITERRTTGGNGSGCGRISYGATGASLLSIATDLSTRQFLFPDGRATRILALAPSPESLPGHVLPGLMKNWIEDFGQDGSRFLVDEHGVDLGAFRHACEDSETKGTPLTLLGSSFGIVNLLERLDLIDLRYLLANRSRLADSGGFKGRSRMVSYPDLCTAVAATLGIEPRYCVNFWSLAEVGSLCFDNVLRNNTPHPRHKVPPPWLKIRVLDPETGAELPDGRVGLLQVLDLTHLDHPASILTDDLGRSNASGAFLVDGKANTASTPVLKRLLGQYLRA